MAKKGEISWKGRTADGERREIYVKHQGDQWLFHERSKRYENWERLENPSLDDWLELLDGVQRRIQRRLFKPEEEARLKKLIRKNFPEADI